MHEGFVRKIHQVVDHEAVVAFHLNQPTVGCPGRIIVPMHVGNACRIGKGGITRPDQMKRCFSATG